MSLDARGREAAEGLRAATPVDVTTGLARIRRSHRRRTLGRLPAAAGVLLAVVLLVGPGPLGDRSTTGPDPAQPPTSSAPDPAPSGTGPSSPPAAPLDTAAWVPYASAQYEIEVGHPADWTEVPATRTWRSTDVVGPLGPGQDSFRSPSGDVVVGVWQMPLASGAPIDSREGIRTWV